MQRSKSRLPPHVIPLKKRPLPAIMAVPISSAPLNLQIPPKSFHDKDYGADDPITALTLSPPWTANHLGGVVTSGAAAGSSSSSTTRPARQWDIEKVLEESDVSYKLHRLALRKEHVEILLSDWNKETAACVHNIEGYKVYVNIRDVDTGISYENLVVARWKNRMYNIQGGWVRSFVRPRNLKKGDRIGISWDKNYACFLFGVISQVNQTAAAAVASH